MITKCILCGFPKGPFKFGKNESYTGSPMVKYDIGEDGSVSNARISRSSGVADIDKKIRAALLGWKFKPRPGCGKIEAEGSVTIDWN
jgi:TonB family protein